MALTKWRTALFIVLVLLAVVVAITQYRKAVAFEDRLGCVATWLEKAKATHEHHMKDRTNTTEDSLRKLMDQIEGGYGCATKAPSHSRIAPGGGLFGMHPVQPH